MDLPGFYPIFKKSIMGWEGAAMQEIPQDKSLESTLSLITEGYDFVQNRCRRYGTNIFQTRLMLQPFICMSGAEAARIFYDNSHFIRQKAAPRRVQKTLFGVGGIQGTDDELHWSRKQMFMSLMPPESIRRLSDLTADQWRAYIHKWEKMDQVWLFDEAEEILCRAVCLWAGVPLKEPEVRMRTNHFEAMIESPAAVGPKHWRGRFERKRAEKWAGGLIEEVRAGILSVPEGCALQVIAQHQDPNGELLNRHVAAVELINVLRPTVAIARYIVFTALALHEHPEYRSALIKDQDGFRECFVQEVRRFYPFFPMVVARVRDDFEWNGYHFPKGRKVALDLYGTNHDPKRWEKPDEFQPERFRERVEDDAFAFIPQGGGDYFLHHRCPGERITIELMKVALGFLTQGMDYEIPKQDLHVRLSQIPALPASRFILTHIRHTPK
jgi:fatty-acid peroxygenase